MMGLKGLNLFEFVSSSEKRKLNIKCKKKKKKKKKKEGSHANLVIPFPFLIHILNPSEDYITNNTECDHREPIIFTLKIKGLYQKLKIKEIKFVFKYHTKHARTLKARFSCHHHLKMKCNWLRVARTKLRKA